MVRKLFYWGVLPALATLFVCFAACNSTPTVPVPPPEMTFVSTSSPNPENSVIVSGESSAAHEGDIVLLFNDDSGKGVMSEAMIDGSFELTIFAETGNVLILQIKRDNVLSVEKELVVPSL